MTTAYRLVGRRRLERRRRRHNDAWPTTFTGEFAIDAAAERSLRRGRRQVRRRLSVRDVRRRGRMPEPDFPVDLFPDAERAQADRFLEGGPYSGKWNCLGSSPVHHSRKSCHFCDVCRSERYSLSLFWHIYNFLVCGHLPKLINGKHYYSFFLVYMSTSR
jgi:hypothetical protein